MSSTLPSFILGYHGCDRSVAEAIFSGSSAHLISSQNKYDWLGHGIYFWENSPQRALNYVREQMWRTTRKRKIHEKQEEVIAAAALPRDGRNEISSPQTLYPRPRRVCISPRASDEQFLKHWEQVASPTRKRMIAKHLLEIVKQHVEASQKFRKSIKRSPEKARKFLISAGILNKKGTRLAKVYR